MQMSHPIVSRYEKKSLRHTALWYELKSVISPLVLTLVPVLGPYLGHRARLCR